jgi:CRISPR/Cas system-associated endonuclease Cas1
MPVKISTQNMAILEKAEVLLLFCSRKEQLCENLGSKYVKHTNNSLAKKLKEVEALTLGITTVNVNYRIYVTLC